MELLLLPLVFLLLLLPYVLSMTQPGRMLPHLLLVLTMLSFLLIFYRTAKFCLTSTSLKQLNRKQRWVLFFVVIIASTMVMYPPWTVTEQILPVEAPAYYTLATMPVSFLPLTSAPAGPPPPIYAPPSVSYEPMYMGFYSETRKWFQSTAGAPLPSLFAPGPLGRKPRNADEEFYCKYIFPTRIVDMNAARLGMQLGVLILLGGFLFWVFTDKGQFTQSSSNGDDDEGTWLIVGPTDEKTKP